MKLSDIIIEVNKDIDDELEAGHVMGWANRCLDDLSPVANYLKTATIPLVAGAKEYDQPTGLILVVQLMDETLPTAAEVELIDLRDYISQGYKVFGSKFIIQPTPKEVKNLTLYYQATLPHLTSVDETPAIRSDYHDLLILYALAKAQYKDAPDEQVLYTPPWQEYLSRKNQFIYEVRRNDSYRIEIVY